MMRRLTDSCAPLTAKVTISLLVIGALSATAQPLTTKSTSQPTTTAAFPSIKPWIAQRESQLDKELAEQLIQRQDATANQLPTLNLQIDLRVVERWLLNLAATSKSQDPKQIIATLRAQEMAEASAQLEAALKTAPPTGTEQLQAMNRLHELTFKLTDPKDGAELDDITRRIGIELLAIGSANAPRPNMLPAMRPPFSATTHPSTQTAVKSLADLNNEIMHSDVSASLRKELLAIAHAAGTEKDSLELRQALGDAVELARGLSSTTSMPAQAREQLENQLAEGLALASDPRTRDAGRQRIGELDEYRTVMTRLATSNLGENVRTALEPALAYAQSHVDDGQAVLNLVQEYIQLTQQFDIDAKGEGPPPTLRSSSQQVAEQFTTARQNFLTAANQLGTVSTVQTLQDQLADLRQLQELYAMLAGMQQTYQTLNAYHPRPYGGIESHVQRAAFAAASSTHNSLRAQGIAYLTQVVRLARLAKTVSQNSLADIPADVLQKYAGVSVNDFSAKCNTLIGDLINQMANGRENDRRQLQRLDAVETMMDGLRQAQLLEQQMQSAAVLQRWVDWSLNAQQIRDLLTPYQQLLSGAFGGFVKDDQELVESFVLGRRRYQPILYFLTRDLAYGDFCATLPEGLIGSAAKLMTPMNNQPFALERYVSFAISISIAINSSDPSGSATAKDSAIEKIGEEFGERK